MDYLYKLGHRIDQWAIRATGIPWLSVVGLFLHQACGQLLRIPLHYSQSPWWMYPIMGIVLGLVHEGTQSLDYGRIDSPWLNVTLDIIAFIPTGPW